MRSSNRARKALTASNRHWGYMSIRAVRQTPYKKYNGTAPNERTDTVIPYRIEHVYVLESGFNFWPCTCRAQTSLQPPLAPPDASSHCLLGFLLFFFKYTIAEMKATSKLRPPHPSAERPLQGVRGSLLSVNWDHVERTDLACYHFRKPYKCPRCHALCHAPKIHTHLHAAVTRYATPPKSIRTCMRGC